MKTFDEVFKQMSATESFPTLERELNEISDKDLKSDAFQKYLSKVVATLMLLTAVSPNIDQTLRICIQAVFAQGMLCGLRMNEVNLESLVGREKE